MGFFTHKSTRSDGTYSVYYSFIPQVFQGHQDLPNARACVLFTVVCPGHNPVKQVPAWKILQDYEHGTAGVEHFLQMYYADMIQHTPDLRMKHQHHQQQQQQQQM